MNAEQLLSEIEQITQAMLETAKLEKWPELASQEARRRTLLASIDSTTLGQARYKDTLQRIVHSNLTITQRLKDRQDDIALLLGAFGPPPAKVE